MKEFSCGAVVPGCSTVFHGRDDDDVLTQVAEHARDAHGMASVPGELVEQVRGLIREV